MKNILLAAVVSLTFLFIVSVSGCMLMHGAMDDMMGHGSGHDGHPGGKAIVKEVEKENLRISMEVPALTASKEAILLVRIADVKTNEPRSNARIKMVISPVSQHDSSHGVVNSSPTEFDAYEGKSKGVYEAKYKFVEAGSYEITALITLSESLSSPVKVSVIQEVGAKKGTSISSTTLMVLGGIGMVLMMGLMIL